MSDRLRRGDDGAALLLVLLIVLAVSLVSGVVLTQADTNVRATVQLRDQASDNYAADAAAQAVLTQLKNGKFVCADPNTAASTTLGSGSTPFYAPVTSVQGSINAAADCTADSGSQSTSGSGVAIGPTNEPVDALLTVGQNYPTEDGIVESGNFNLCVNNGKVESNSTINGTVSVGVSSSGDPSACPNNPSSGVVVSALRPASPSPPGCNGTFTPTPCTYLTSAKPTPQAPAPTGTITAGNTDQAAVCQKVGSTTYAAFLPGLYTRATSATQSSLNAPCRQGSNWVQADFDWFTPGTYYFNFGTDNFTAPLKLIAGTPTKPDGTQIGGLNGTNAATLASSTLSNLSQATAFPGACASPLVQSALKGVEFVFAGGSTMTFPPGTGGGNANADICASYVDVSTVPIAIYGLNTALTVGSTTLPAETPGTHCVATPGCTGGATGLPSLLNSPVNGQAAFHIEGYTYAPAAGMILTFKNSIGQVFNWGIIVRTFQLTANGASPVGSFIQLPKSGFGVVTTYTVRYLNVWTCIASASPCATNGTPNVRVKVLSTFNTDGTMATVKVLSWAHRR